MISTETLFCVQVWYERRHVEGRQTGHYYGVGVFSVSAHLVLDLSIPLKTCTSTSPVAQQGKGPSPLVVERFQSVASQLMSQVSYAERMGDLTWIESPYRSVSFVSAALLMMTVAT